MIQIKNTTSTLLS